MPTESFLAFKHCGLAKNRDGTVISTAAQLVQLLKDKMYRIDRDPRSKNLKLSKLWFIINYENSLISPLLIYFNLNRTNLKYTDFIKINACLGKYVDDKLLSQFSLIFLLEFIGKSPRILSDISRLQALYKVQKHFLNLN